MTWSIVARHPNGPSGVAVASRSFAVGALCPHARSGAGAFSTQALMNPGYGPAGLDLRVDDHEEPLAEPRRLHAKSLERYQPFVACLPTRANPAGITDRAAIEREIERVLAGRPLAAASASPR